MARKGHRRTPEQVHVKVKQLRQAYARATRGAAAGAATCPYFPALDRLLGGGAVCASLGDSDLGPEGPDLGTAEGPPPAVPALESAGSSREALPAAPAACAGRSHTWQKYWDQHLGVLRALHHTIEAWTREDLQLRREQLAEDRAINANLQALLQSMLLRAGPAPAAPPRYGSSSHSCPPPTSSSSTSTPSSSMSTPPPQPLHPPPHLPGDAEASSPAMLGGGWPGETPTPEP
ncbi:uncharacterized protein LOC142823392 [Pelodiscus sinensis]|uniref:uncharacterized protein LOC142823392 n=1 Tax=Pelodiscus sinensis TaxID=13735 RepID=UPI003F6B2F7F